MPTRNAGPCRQPAEPLSPNYTILHDKISSPIPDHLATPLTQRVIFHGMKPLQGAASNTSCASSSSSSHRRARKDAVGDSQPRTPRGPGHGESNTAARLDTEQRVKMPAFCRYVGNQQRKSRQEKQLCLSNSALQINNLLKTEF